VRAANADAAVSARFWRSAMQANNKISFKTFLAGLCFVVLSWGLALSGAKAQENPRPPTAEENTDATAPVNPASTSTAKRYFVEFRSRSALSYGHTFLVHGKLNAKGEVGQVTKNQVAGLHPFSESSVPWMIGHLIPVVADHGFSDGDIEDEYITARYRVLLTEQEYARVSAYIRSHTKNSPLWHAVLYNCNAWVGDVVKFMGLKAPGSTMLYPEDYIETIAKLNGGTVSRPTAKPAAKPARTAAAKPAAKPATAAKPAKPQTVATPAAAPEAQTVR
jgi:hypothetical protein